MYLVSQSCKDRFSSLVDIQTNDREGRMLWKFQFMYLVLADSKKRKKYVK